MSNHSHRIEDTGRAPSRGRRGSRRRAHALAAGIVALALAMLVVSGSRVVAALPATHPTTPANPRSTQAGAKPKPGQNLCASRLPWDTIRQQAAREMRLSVAQVRARILRGKPIQNVAAAQRISPTRLHTIELHALEIGNERWIRLGCNTRQEGDAYMRVYRRMTRAQLNEEFTSLFVES